MLLLKKEDIIKAFSMKDAISSNEKAFKIFEKGECKIPLRTNISAKNNNFLFMPAYSKEINAAVLKNVNIFPDNDKKNLPTTLSDVLLIDGDNGFTKAIIDGTYLTQIRTGAATGVAFKYLAKKDCNIGGVIGAGGQSKSQILALIEVKNLELIKIFDMNFNKAKKLANTLANELNQKIEIIPVDSSKKAVLDSDLIVTVTTSKNPVFNSKYVKKGATISCVGSYKENMQEMDPSILKKASKIFFDSKEAVLEESGDLIIPLKNNIIPKSKLTGNIGKVLNKSLKGRTNDNEIIVFKTVGIAIQDLVTAENIYQNALDKNIGTIWKK